jgi:anti-sigma B factor antagonist
MSLLSAIHPAAISHAAHGSARANPQSKFRNPQSTPTPSFLRRLWLACFNSAPSRGTIASAHTGNRSMPQLKTGTDLIPTARHEGDALFASVAGEIDLHNSPDLRTALLDMLIHNPVRRLVLNLSNVPYMDSSAIAVLVELLQRLRKSGGRIILVAPQPRVRGLLEIARLDTIFKLVDSESEAT